MSVVMDGRDYVSMDEAVWDACLEIACEFGWMPKYERMERKGEEFLDPDYEADAFPEDNARALARSLYRAIHAIEADSLSERLVDLVKTASVRNLRAVADIAYAGGFDIRTSPAYCAKAMAFSIR